MVRSLAPLLRIIFRVAFIRNQYASCLCCLLHSALYLFDFRRRAHCSLVYPRHQLGDLYTMITTISKYVPNQLEQIKRAWTCLSRACEWKSDRNVQLRINTWLLKNQWMNVLDIDSIANPTTRVGTLHISLYQLSSKNTLLTPVVHWCSTNASSSLAVYRTTPCITCHCMNHSFCILLN